VSADGHTIKATRPLHKTILEEAPPKDDKTQTKARFHTHVLACIPEDTDVMAVLSRSPIVPEYIACDPFMYAVDPDGSIRVLGLTKEILKDKEAK